MVLTESLLSHLENSCFETERGPMKSLVGGAEACSQLPTQAGSPEMLPLLHGRESRETESQVVQS